MFLLLSIVLNITSLFASPFSTGPAADAAVATVRVVVDGDELATPVVRLGGDSRVAISFDDLSYEPRNYYYRILHCDARWRPSDLMPMEYLDGMDDIMISDYTFSTNTTTNYIHYSFELPNDDVSVKLSGNYVVIVALDNDFDNQVVATACFSVVEPLAALRLDCSATTLRGINGPWQQLAVEGDVSSVGSVDPLTDFTLVVRQNDRADNQAIVERPTFSAGSTIRYMNSPLLTFEGGNQYRTVDFSSRYTYGSGIDRFVFRDGAYHVLLDPIPMGEGRRTYADDAHGRSVVHLQGAGDYSATEADYAWVHFTLASPSPLPDARVALLGSLCYNRPESAVLMYDTDQHIYYVALFLKQGGYNFQFAALHDAEATLVPTEGSYWQTANAYRAYLYYRPRGSRYDRLVGFSELQ